MRSARGAIAILALTSCTREAPPPRQMDVSMEEGSVRCNSECLSGWWLSVRGGCRAYCLAAPPAFRECSHADCEQLDARLYGSEGAERLVPFLHSASARTFTALPFRANGSWEVRGTECTYTSNDVFQVNFECRNGQLIRGGAALERPSPELAASLDVAVTIENLCEHSY